MTDDMISEMVEKLRELPDGTEVSVYELIERCGYDAQHMEFHELFDVDCDFRKAAGKAHIQLDSYKYAGIPIGLPYSIPFIVRKKPRKYNECPYCGSRNSARILYGLPGMDEELEAKIQAGKVCLGGCSVPWAARKRYCNDCGKEF